MALFAPEKSCAVCKKKFLMTDEWRYKRGELVFCSWGHMREHDANVAMEKSTRQRRLTKHEQQDINKLLTTRLTVTEIAEIVGVSVQAIQYYKQKARA